MTDKEKYEGPQRINKKRVATGDTVAPTKMKELNDSKTHPCKGSSTEALNQIMRYTPEQAAWMKENKPLYYTGRLNLDISHLPPHLRSL